MLADLFTPTLADARHRVSRIHPRNYASTRNFLDGAVTMLSPYITHGFVEVAEIAKSVAASHSPEDNEKLLMEFGWREFFQHVWRHAGEGILRDMRPGIAGVRYASAMPDDILAARTGIPVIDHAVRTLYQTGYLHNHARMWVASYVVHLRKVSWRAGADWMMAHLLDGDPASNHLSWQWVAGTFSHKPYLFNAENVARYAPQWASAGTALDISYDALDEIARSNRTVAAEAGAVDVVATLEPPLLALPEIDSLTAEAFYAMAASGAVLIHPWDLGEHVGETSINLPRIGILHTPFHAQFPWSRRRWDFVLTRMREITPYVFAGDLAALFAMNSAAGPRFHARDTYHFGYREALRHAAVVRTAVPRFTADPDIMCASFTRFWSVAGLPRVPRGGSKGIARK